MPIQFPRTAEQFIAQHWDGRLPVNVEAMARRAGIRIEEVTFDDPSVVCEQVWGGDVPVIRIERGQIGTRRSFAIAHSIGHFCLGHMGTAAQPAYTSPSPSP